MAPRRISEACVGEGGVFTFHTEQICNVRGHIAHDGKSSMWRAGGYETTAAVHAISLPSLAISGSNACRDGDAIMVTVAHFAKQDVKSAYYYKAGSDANEDLEILEHPPCAG